MFHCCAELGDGLAVESRTFRLDVSELGIGDEPDLEGVLRRTAGNERGTLGELSRKQRVGCR